MTHYEMCKSAGLDCCQQCRRNAENNGNEQYNPHQRWIMPTDNDHCRYFLPQPLRDAVKR